jgi:hypothetical protein
LPTFFARLAKSRFRKDPIAFDGIEELVITAVDCYMAFFDLRDALNITDYGCFRSFCRLKKLWFTERHRTPVPQAVGSGPLKLQKGLIGFVKLEETDEKPGRVIPEIIISPWRQLDRTIWEETQESIETKLASQHRYNAIN